MAKTLISVVVALILVSSTLGSSDVPFIVAHKKASLTRLKSGAERVSVSIDIYNQGSTNLHFPRLLGMETKDLLWCGSSNTGEALLRTAYDVSLTDDSWSQDVFNIVSGNTSTSWERLDAGGLLSHAFELESKVEGMFYGAPAVITFRIPTTAALQEAYSTPILPLDILAVRPPEKKFEWRLLAKYGSQISVISIVSVFVYLVASPSKSGAGKGSKKKR
ncbi:hypothetical protein CK203_015062 [Vitis vinifera]|uniref:Translocon-associated protein subunit beta n=1 Tax=Vitis vinifera TaxID=29760 RepID=A0A438JCZ7_VITVI|nr:hypothetical protein CK203_015062 [Vitis vinifera]